VAGGGDHVHADVGDDVEDPVLLDEGVLDIRQLDPERVARPRPDHRQDRPLAGDVLRPQVAADAVGPDHVLEHGDAAPWMIYPDPVGTAQDAHVHADLALVAQQQRVAAGPRCESLHVVRHLSLEEVGGLGAAEDQHPARAFDDAGCVAKELVLGGRDHSVRG
jgi:hypothetical protein